MELPQRYVEYMDMGNPSKADEGEVSPLTS